MPRRHLKPDSTKRIRAAMATTSVLDHPAAIGPGLELLGDPGGEAGGRISQREGERLGLRALDPLVARLVPEPGREALVMRLLLGGRMLVRLPVPPHGHDVEMEPLDPIGMGIAEARGRGLGEVQRVLLQERARELELFRRQTFVDEQLQLAQSRAQRERRLRIRQGADPDLEELLAPFLAGLAVSQFVTPRGWLDRFRSPSSPRNLLASAGRHSLAFYLIHQPVLIGLVYTLSLVAPPPPVDQVELYKSSCEKSCVEQANELELCQRFCGCTLEKLQAESLFDIMMEGKLTADQQTKVSEVAQQCTVEAQ